MRRGEVVFFWEQKRFSVYFLEFPWCGACLALTVLAFSQKMPPMSEKRSRLLLIHLRPGMVLAQAVTATDGALLMNAGATISMNYLQHLALRGIKRVWIQGDSSHRDDETAEDLLARIEVRGRRVEHMPLMRSLLDKLRAELEIRVKQ